MTTEEKLFIELDNASGKIVAGINAIKASVQNPLSMIPRENLLEAIERNNENYANVIEEVERLKSLTSDCELIIRAEVEGCRKDSL